MNPRVSHSGTSPTSYEVLEVLGCGGMGVVCRGRHIETGLDVAIKVLSAGWAREPLYREAFRHEVRAVASLVHEGIISIFDHGLVGQGLCDERLTTGSPYLVMEYVEAGSLERWAGAWSFELLCALLLQVTSALSHAHARGVIHRDLKPGNILVGRRGERLVFTLADFGIAHAWVLDEAQPEVMVAGTPSYMPPEQILGQSQALGPWTDLYALGCLAWELCCGYPPFEAATPLRTMALHLNSPPPPLQPQLPVPEWFEGWLWRLLCKDHEQRFRCAADAAWALRRRMVGGTSALSWERWLEQMSVSPTPERAHRQQGDGVEAFLTTIAQHTADVTALLAQATPNVLSVVDGSSAERAQEVVVAVNSEPAPCPASWQVEHFPRGDTGLANVGLGLFGLREVPFVARDAERDVIWGALSRVRERASPGAVCIIGPSGVGKSELIEWISLRAAELGAAHVLHARHMALGGPRHGLGPMLARALRLPAGARAQRFEALLSWLQVTDQQPHHADELEAEAAALLELIEPGGDSGGDAGVGGLARVRFGDDRERYALLWRALERIHRQELGRPLILWLDDLQWGADTLEFVRWVFTRRATSQPLPLLVMMSSRADILAERLVESAALEQLLKRPEVEQLPLEPLSPSDHARFVEALLKLEPKLHRELVRRTLGNPLFAVQLVGDWIERGWLVLIQGKGFTLQGHGETWLPDDLHTLWRQRIGRLMLMEFSGERALHARGALEIAALLGQEVDQMEWETVCMLARYSPDPRLLDVLSAQGLVRGLGGAQGFSFVHGMLRESLERLAHEAQRAHEHHDVITQMLRVLYGEHALGNASRLAHHLVLAGRASESLGPLLDASYQAQLEGRYRQAEAHLAEHARQAERLGLLSSDARVLRAQQQGVWLSWLRHGVSPKGHEQNARIMELARAQGVDDVCGECLRWRALVLRFDGELQASVEELEEALVYFERAHDDAGAARTRQSMAVVLRMLGQLARAEDELTQAIALAERSDLFILLPRCFGNLAQVSLQRGVWELAKARFDRALGISLELGDRKAAAFARIGLGELALCLDDGRGAYTSILKAVEGFEALGSRYAKSARLDLACVELLYPELGHAKHEVLDEVLDASWSLPLELCTAYGVRLLMALSKGPQWLDVWDELWPILERAFDSLDESRWLLVLLFERVRDMLMAHHDQERSSQAARWAKVARGLLHRRAPALTLRPS